MKSRYVHKHHSDSGDDSAAEMVPILCTMLKPASVADVGCGIGNWLIEFMKNGVDDILGIDGFHLDTSLFLPERRNLIQTDLEKPFTVNRSFDLVICLEVAEHLEESTASQFIQSLTRLGNTILFSAAIPGQGGQNHVNERWPSYWQEKFMENGFHFYDIIRPRIWQNERIKPYYRQNMFLASRNDFPVDLTLPVIGAVHPDLLIEKADKYLTGAFGLKSTLKKWREARVKS